MVKHTKKQQSLTANTVQAEQDDLHPQAEEALKPELSKDSVKEKAPPQDRMLHSRFELKYYISETQVAFIREHIKSYMRPDPYCQDSPTGDYVIASLYLDSSDLCLCHQSMQGEKNRFKLRIRRYNDDPTCPSFLEIKRRTNNIINKSRAAVDVENIENLFSPFSHLSKNGNNNVDKKALRQFQIYKGNISAEPVAVIRYRREAYECRDGSKVRLTFDRDLAYKFVNNYNFKVNGKGWRKCPMENVILEIKYTDYFPGWMTRLVSALNIQPESIPKYVQSVQHASDSYHYGVKKLPEGDR